LLETILSKVNQPAAENSEPNAEEPPVPQLAA